MLLIASLILTIAVLVQVGTGAGPGPPEALPVVAQTDTALPVVYNGTGAGSFAFLLSPRTQFAVLSVSDADTIVLIQLGSETLRLAPSTVLLSAHPNYNDFFLKNCAAAADSCLVTVNITHASVPFVVRGQQGALLPFGEDQHAHLAAKSQTRVYGLFLTDDMLPALISLSPVGADDFDLTVYTFSGADFTKQFPGTLSGQQNAHSNFPEKVLVQNLANTFLRIDVTLRSLRAADFVLRLNPNYDAFDLYQLSLAGTIGAACLLAMCLLASICIIVAKRSAARAVFLDGGPMPGFQGLTSADIDAATQKKKAVELSLSVDDNMCVICLDEYDGRDDVRVLPCGHHFHSDCITTWFNAHKHCPLCHRDVPESPVAAAAAHII